MIKKGSLAALKLIERPRKPSRIIVRKRARRGDYLYRLINCEDLRAGDEVTVRARGDLKLRIHGPIVQDGDAVTLTNPGALFVSAQGHPRSRVEIDVKAPPLQDPLAQPLVGPGLYWAHSAMAGIPFRRYVDLTADAGFNYFRDILPSHSWLPGYTQSIWRRLQSGKWELSALDRSFCARLRADLWYARKRGVVVHLDLFDHHLLRFWDVWGRSEFNGANNTLGYPLPRHYGDRPENLVEHPLKGVWDYPEGHPDRALQRAYAEEILDGWRRFVGAYIPPGHIVGDGNELESRSVSRAILSNVDYPVKAYGGQPLRQDSAIEHICKDVELMEQISYICLHNTDLADWADGTSPETWYARVLPILDRWPHIRALLSNDGTGSLRQRVKLAERIAAECGRPLFPEIKLTHEKARAVFGARYGGLGDIKTLSPQDTLALFNFWKNQILE